VGERVSERAAARLAVGVLELDAVDDRVGLDRELGRRLHEAALEGGGRGHDLEGGAGRLWGRERDAGQRAQLAVARVERGHSAEPPGQPHDSSLLEAGVDRGLDRGGGPRPGAREHAAARDQLAARAAAQALLEDLLQPRLPDRPVMRETARVQCRALLGRLPRLHEPGDRVRDPHER
jgi:hypothetical protein